MKLNRMRPALKLASLSTSKHKIIIDGNSISFGQGTSGAPSVWPQIMLASLKNMGADATLAVTSFAAPGERILINNGGFAAMITKLYGGGGLIAALDPVKVNIVFALEGTNELTANNFDGMAAAKAMESYFLQLTEGAKTAPAGAGLQGVQLKRIVQTTLPYCRGTTDAEANSYMQAAVTMNDEIRRNWHKYADVLVDHDKFGEFKLIRDQAVANGGVYTRAMLVNSPIFQLSSGAATDYIHLGDYGHTQIAASNLIGLRRLGTRKTLPTAM